MKYLKKMIEKLKTYFDDNFLMTIAIISITISFTLEVLKKLNIINLSHWWCLLPVITVSAVCLGVVGIMFILFYAAWKANEKGLKENKNK